MDPQHLDHLQRRRDAARRPDAAALGRLHEQGKLSARERIERLLDPGSFVELGVLARSGHPALAERTPADGLVAGHGTIDGRIVYVAADDGSVLGGTRGKVGELKVARTRAAALAHRKPFIALMEAGAARVQESFGAMAAGMGTRFVDHFRMSGQVPQVAAILGPAFGGPSFTAVQSDFTTLARDTGFMGMSGPIVVKVGIGQAVSSADIGGADVCAVDTGQADHVGDTEADCLAAIRAFLGYLPSHSGELPPVQAARPAAVDTPEGRVKLNALVPDLDRQAYDMRKVLGLLVDGGELLHYRPKYGPSLVTALARFNGQPVGIVASNPMARGGVLDERSAQKARKFVDLCDAFHLPLVFVCDAPGFLVGPEIEKHRMVSLAGRLLNTVAAASVPKITIVARKAIGLAYIAMGGRAMNPDAIVAWPGAHFDVMGPEAGVEIVHGKAIAAAADPVQAKAEVLARLREESSAFKAAEMGLIDDVIEPADTRQVILQTLARCEASRQPRFKHRIDP